MGPVERRIPSVLDLMRLENANPKAGRPLSIERVYRANLISEAEYKAILDEQKLDRQRQRNSDAISDMEAESLALDERMRRANVPDSMRTVAVDLTKISDLLSGRWLYVRGNDNVATTRRACMALKGWMAKRSFGTALFTRSTAMLSAFRSDESDSMGNLATVDILVVTGLGAEAATDWAIGKLHEVLDARSVDSLPTIVTSWFNPQELAEHLGGRGNDGAARAIVRMLRDNAILVEV